MKDSSIMYIDEKCIERMLEIDYIPVDSRIFAMLYTSIKPTGCIIVLHKNSNSREFIVPLQCFYLSLSPNINNTCYCGQEIKSILYDAQGHWIASIHNKYIGITKYGIKEAYLTEWFNFYRDILVDKLKYLKNKTYFGERKKQKEDLLSSIKKYDTEIAMYSFNNIGYPILLHTYSDITPL